MSLEKVGERDIFDYATALMARGGIFRPRPWIARDAAKRITSIGVPETPSGRYYDVGIHVRRGDKLRSDARPLVEEYWNATVGGRSPDARKTPNYIPLKHYLSKLDGCAVDEEKRVRQVYVATDDPAEVRREMSALVNSTRRETGGGGAGLVSHGGCLYNLTLAPDDASLDGGYHTNVGYKFRQPREAAEGECRTIYARTVAGAADLSLLATAGTFVGEYNSNWGRLVRHLRLRFDRGGAASVRVRDMAVAFGSDDPGVPGFRGRDP